MIENRDNNSVSTRRRKRSSDKERALLGLIQDYLSALSDAAGIYQEFFMLTFILDVEDIDGSTVSKSHRRLHCSLNQTLRVLWQ